MNIAHRPARRVTFAVTLSVLALAVSSCAGGLIGATPAATVNGTVISQEDLQASVDAQRLLIEAQIASEQAALDEPDPEQPSSFTQESLDAAAAEALAPYGDGTGSYPTENASAELTQLITDELIRQELERQDALPTEADLDEARAGLTQQVGGAEQLAEIDSDAVDLIVETRALDNAFQASLAPDETAREEQLRELYETAIDELPLCLNLIYLETQASADEAFARIEGGEDFGVVAADVSLAPATVEDRGFGGCASFEQAETLFGVSLEGESVGFVSGPHTVESPDGASPPSFVLAEIESTDGVDFDRLRPQLESQLPADDPAALGQVVVQELVADAEISVDPRYGSWDPETLSVVPPDVPGTTEPSSSEPVLVPGN